MKSSLFIFLFTFIAFVSCSKQDPTQGGGLVIKLEEKSAPQSSALKRNSSLNPQAPSAPVSISDFNCFAANVTGSGINIDNRINENCASPNNFSGRGVGIFSRPVNRGRSIELDVPTGNARTIDIYGIFPPTGPCRPDGLKVETSGYLLGSVKVDLAESKTVTVPISYSGSSPLALQCTIPTPPGALAIPTFGDGTDGDVVVPGNIPDIRSDSSLIAGRVFSAQRRINNIAADFKTLTVDSAVTSAEFRPGDEVFWVVVARDNASSCGGLFLGQNAFAKVEQASTSTIVLDRPLTAGPVNNSALIENDTLNPFCRIQIVRVPNINNMTVTGSGVYLQSSNSPYIFTNNPGIAVLKIKGSLTLNGSFYIDVSSTGFGSTGTQSSGTGWASGERSNWITGAYGGGGYAFGNGRSAGGGAGASSFGGAGTGSGPGDGGTPPTCAQPGACLFLGSSGGSGASGPGGPGGGIAVLHAKQIVPNGYSLTVRAGGWTVPATSSDGASGAGGGGSIVVKTKTAPAANFDLIAPGGTGGDSTTAYGGGGGGAGYAQAKFCSGSSPTTSCGPGNGGIGSGGSLNGMPGIGVCSLDIELNPAHPFCSE